MVDTKRITEELAQHLVAQWFQELQDRHIVSPPTVFLHEVTVQTIASLLESLQRPDWKEASLPTLRVLRFLADQLDFPLEQALKAFLRLRRHVVIALAKLFTLQQQGQSERQASFETTPESLAPFLTEAHERVDWVFDEGILRLTTDRQRSAQTQWEWTHQKYRTFFEQASDAFLLIRMDDVGTIVEANPAAERLTGYPLSELVGLSALALAPKEEWERYQKALEQLRRTGHARLSGIGLKRKDGVTVFVDLSTSLLEIENQAFALCIARDVTEQLRLQRRLEAVVAHRTKELAEALERERLFAAQMAVLAQIAAEALEAVREEAIYHATANALQEHLHLHNVALFAYDPDRHELILKACQGAYKEVWGEAYRQSADVGLLSVAVRTGEPVLVNDVSRHPDYYQATPVERATQSELVVPIKLHGTLIGVLDLQALQKDAFDQQDLQMAQTVADFVAHALDAIAHFNRVRMLQELSEQIVENLPYAVALLDERGKVILANEQFCRGICRLIPSEAVGQHWKDIFPEKLQQAIQGQPFPPLEKAIVEALEHQQDFFYPEVPYDDLWVDIRVIPIRGGQRRVMLHLRDASLRVRRIYQLETLMAIAQAMESTYEINRLLHAILTAATAGPGLGFNRAILFLVDKSAEVLKVAMAVGPLTAEEAYATWARLAAERKTLWDFLREYPGDEAVQQTPLMQAVRDITVPLSDENLLTHCLRYHEPLRIPHPLAEERLPQRLRALLGDAEAICVPLVTQDEWLGTIVADNAFSRHPITKEAARLLRLFASSASVALRNAQLISELKAALEREQRMREQLVHSERLAAIGELAAKIAHDIRSPLVTIGGYARQLQRHPNDPERVQRNTQIIVDEVERLERHLRDLLDFAAPKKPQPKRVNLTELVARLADLHRPSMEAAAVTLHVEISPEPLFAQVDELQMERVLLNLWRNAVEAMPEGGTLTVRLWREGATLKLSVSDTGMGIVPEELPHIFKPFYSSKNSGSGLGLAICKKIVDEHGGTIEVTSTPGVGTTFTVSLPLAEETVGSFPDASVR